MMRGEQSVSVTYPIVISFLFAIPIDVRHTTHRFINELVEFFGSLGSVCNESRS